MDDSNGRTDGAEKVYINFNITFQDKEDKPIKLACLPLIKLPDFFDLIREKMTHRIKNYIVIKFQGSEAEMKLDELNLKLTLDVSTHFASHKDFIPNKTSNLDINLEFFHKKTFVLKVFALKYEEKDKKESIAAVEKFLKGKIDFVSEPIIELLNDYQIQTKIDNQFLVVVTVENFMEKVVDNVKDIDIILFWADPKSETVKKFNSQLKKPSAMNSRLGLLLTGNNLKVVK